MFAVVYTLCAQEQQPGKELVFPKDTVKEHPSDLHMGSDPYYKKENKKYEGTDETGYPRGYDPNAQYEESTTTYKKKHKKKKHDSSRSQD
jgi:hypothetical protein